MSTAYDNFFRMNYIFVECLDLFSLKTIRVYLKNPRRFCLNPLPDLRKAVRYFFRNPSGAEYLDLPTRSGASESRSEPNLLRLRCKLVYRYFVEFFLKPFLVTLFFLSFILPFVLLSCLAIHLRQFYG